MPPRRRIDLNADLGESFGRYRLGDAALLDVVTSANIACGFHAGDPVVMRDTVRAAAERGVTIGAHPGYPDLQGFGRRELAASPAEIAAYVIYQVGALHACCTAEGTRVRYVKLHGALYHRASHDAGVADAVVGAVHAVDPSLMILGLANSALARSAAGAAVRVASEAFLDRQYRADGTLVPRNHADALLHDPDAAAERAVRVALGRPVPTIDGAPLALTADSLCVHSDGPMAVAMARAAREALEGAEIRCVAFAVED